MLFGKSMGASQTLLPIDQLFDCGILCCPKVGEQNVVLPYMIKVEKGKTASLAGLQVKQSRIDPNTRGEG